MPKSMLIMKPEALNTACKIWQLVSLQRISAPLIKHIQYRHHHAYRASSCLCGNKPLLSKPCKKWLSGKNTVVAPHRPDLQVLSWSSHSGRPADDEYIKEIIREINKDFQDVQNKHEEDNDRVPEADGAQESVKEIDNEVKKFNIDEELLRYDYEEFDNQEDTDLEEEEHHSISLERGSTGVFDLHEIVQVLKEDNGQDVCVISVAADINYCDSLVIVTGRSPRHLQAMAQYVKRLYKMKRTSDDNPSCAIEGRGTEWLAMDLGSTVVHLFTAEVRVQYDLETLWTVGPAFDDQSRKQENEESLTFFWDKELLNSSGRKHLSMESVQNWHQKT